MPSTIKELFDKGLAHPPKWLPCNVHFEAMTGSVSYGCSSDTSDMDIVSWCIPRKEDVFGHLKGEIIGFDKSDRFSNYMEHHIFDKDALGGKGREYDLSCHNIIDYFKLAMECNPNIIDTLYVPPFCILHITRIGQIVRDNRKLFLHKGAYHRFRGYAFSQLNKARNTGSEDKAVQEIRSFEDDNEIPHTVTFNDVKNELKKRSDGLSNLSNINLNKYHEMFKNGLKKSKRFESRKIHNVDLKFLYHVVRLSDECEQILIDGDIDIQRSREYLKAIRRGDVSEEEIRLRFTEDDKHLKSLYETSSLQHSPDENAIKTLLLNCLEEHYGSLDKCITNPDQAVKALRDIQEILDKNRSITG